MPLSGMTPRPALKILFATNNYHQTWHILSDSSGGQFLAKVFWWLSYQRAPNSLVAIAGDALVPNPFDADPSSPIAIFNADTTHLSRAATDDLRTVLRRKPSSEGSVRVTTPSLRQHVEGRTEASMSEHWKLRSKQFQLTDRVNGVLRVTASAEQLRWWAILLSDLGSTFYRGSNHTYLSESRLERWPQGEVQIFRSFTAMVKDAVLLREEMFPGTAHRELIETEREAVHKALPKGHIDR